MLKWVEGHLQGQIFHNMSNDLAAIAIQGPAAKDVMARLTSADLNTLVFFSGAFVRLDGIPGSHVTTPLLKGRTPSMGSAPGLCPSSPEPVHR